MQQTKKSQVPTKRVTGHCTSGCGACCRLLAMPIRKEWPNSMLAKGLVPVPRLNADVLHFLVVRGVEPRGGNILKVPNPQNGWHRGKYAGKDVVFYRSTCPQLAENGMCKLYGQPQRPKVCERFPTPWDDLVGIDDVCTYHIEESNGEVSKEASSAP